MTTTKTKLVRLTEDRRIGPRRVEEMTVDEERRIVQRRTEPRRAFEWIDHFVEVNEEPLEIEEPAPATDIKDLDEVIAATAAELEKEK